MPGGAAQRPIGTTIATKIEDQAAQIEAHRHEPVRTLPKQPITFGTQQVHSGRTTRGG